MKTVQTEPALFIIFGGTGDLARRKLLAALGKLWTLSHLGAPFHVLGVARDRNHTDESYRDLALDSMEAAGLSRADLAPFVRTSFHYQCVAEGKPEDYRALGVRIAVLEETCGLPGNRAFYLALPPKSVPGVIDGLGGSGLAVARGWTRIVVEKPFGRDLESAQALNRHLHTQFDESQIYRIDHYLGKETVQNLSVFRFANSVFESVWNRNHIDAVYLTVAEELGVEGRAGYYDSVGAVRDMVQNHLSQLLSLIAMEPPYAFTASAIRQEKIKVLHSVTALDYEDVIFGQYQAGRVNGEPVRGYLEEKDVRQGSAAETFVAMKLFIDNWRWSGVPFSLRTGKRLQKRLTQIDIHFKRAPVCMFQAEGSCLVSSNVLSLILQPNEGFSLRIEVKKPGPQYFLEPVPLSFKYGDRFGALPEAYETLLVDLLIGDQTLFVHCDEVEASWSLFEPLTKLPRKVHAYPAGTWGPKEAVRVFAKEPV